MRQVIFIIICLTLFVQLHADNKKPLKSGTPIIKIESNWTNSGIDNTATNSSTSDTINIITITEGITYYTSKEGIFLTLNKSTSNLKLFSLTGEIVWQGNLVQGSFLIPIKQGIYFLRINNKSYKVVRK